MPHISDGGYTVAWEGRFPGVPKKWIHEQVRYALYSAINPLPKFADYNDDTSAYRLAVEEWEAGLEKYECPQP